MTIAGTRGHSPPIHLWTYNHSIYRISDQVDYLVRAFRQQGYQTSIGTKPSDSALNVVIENFSARTRKTLIDFCTRTRKRVAVVMTEHIDFLNHEILMHGDPLWSANDYMRPSAQVERLECLMSCQPYIRFFMVLGDLPELRNFGDMVMGAEIRAIPFPKLDRVIRAGVGQIEPRNGLLFTGSVTDYRKKLLRSLQSLGFPVECPMKFASAEQRDQLNQSAKIVLNIPQRERWPWLSLMRVVAALRCGRATVSLGTRDKSRISACTYQLDLQSDHWSHELKAYVDNWAAAYDTMYDAYCRLAKEFDQEYPFPHDMIDFWAMTDRT